MTASAPILKNEARAALGPRLVPSAWVDIPQALLADLQAVLDLFPECRQLMKPDGSRFYVWAPDDSGIDVALYDTGLMIIGHNDTRWSGAMGSCMSASKVTRTIRAIVQSAKAKLKPLPEPQMSLF